MATYKNLADAAVGSRITVQEKGKTVEYLVLQHNWRTVGGVPQTLLIRRYLAKTGQWNWVGTNTYKGSTIDNAMQDFLSSSNSIGVDASIALYIPEVSIQIHDIGGVVSAINRKCFALSAAEMQAGEATPTDEGSAIPYFNTANSRIATDASGNAQYYWLRSPCRPALLSNAGDIEKNGQGGNYTQVEALAFWYRPAFCLPANLILQDGFAIPDLSPLAPGSIDVNGSNAIMGGQPFTVSWSASSDDKIPANQLVYEVQRSYNGGAWETVSVVSGGQTSITTTVPNNVATTVRYAVFATDDKCRSIDTRTSGAVAVVNNSAPTTPPSIAVNAPPLLKGGPVAVSWSAATDPDGNLTGYQLEQQPDGGAWAQVYSGAALAWSGTLGSWGKVAYRVRAVDSFNAVSGYRTSSAYTLQTPVHITVAVASDSGLKNGSAYTTDTARTIKFTVANAADAGMAQSYTQLLTLDGKQLSKKSGVISGGAYSYALTKAAWQTIRNGSRALLLTVTDAAGNSGAGTIGFTKNVTEVILETDPIPVEIADGSALKHFMLNLLGYFPAGSQLTIEVTNNAEDPAPVWQVVLPDQINSGGLNLISNSNVTNGNFFALRVTGNRGTAGEGCWIDQISGVAGKSNIFVLAEENDQLREDLAQEITDRAAGDAALQQALQAGLAGLLRYRGDVPTYADLPAAPGQWDMWKITATGEEYYWDGSGWDPLDFTISVDTAPAEGSLNPVSSGGVYAAMSDVSTFFSALEPTLDAILD
jgi:hypothetical protein